MIAHDKSLCVLQELQTTQFAMNEKSVMVVFGLYIYSYQDNSFPLTLFTLRGVIPGFTVSRASTE